MPYSRAASLPRSGGEDYFTHEAGGAYDFRRDMSPRCGKGCSQIASADQGKYSSTVFSERAVEVVQQHKDPETPLFLYLAFQGVHSPAQAPQSYIDAYNATITDEPQRRTFAGMLSCVDEGIANVSKALQARDMLKDTFIVFTTVRFWAVLFVGRSNRLSVVGERADGLRAG